jgi:hypothetical protein
LTCGNSAQIAAIDELDQAATGTQVEEVEPSDRWRDDHERSFPDDIGGRGVADDLGDIVTVDDGAGGEGEVLTDPQHITFHVAGMPPL